MIEETAEQTTVTGAEEQAKEPQTEQKTEQWKQTPETQPQRDEDTSTTPPEEVDLTICDCIIIMLYQLTLFLFQGDSQPVQCNQVSQNILNYIVFLQTIVLLKVHSCYYYSHRILER